MGNIRLYSNYQEAEFLERLNRFVMKLKLGDKVIDAYVPNTGRMTELLFPGRKFFITQLQMPKYQYKVIGTEYNGSYVFLDTIKVNRIFQEIVQQRILPEFSDYIALKREVKIGNSKYDFKLQYKNNLEKIIEIKSCTLCHKGAAMFPDAPTERGQRHLKGLDDLAVSGLETWVTFLITNFSAERFFPNYHIDINYGKLFMNSKAVRSKAIKVKFSDPVTVIPEATENVPIDHAQLEKNCGNRGTYLLVLNNRSFFRMRIGALGEIDFSEGYYIYVGSALKNLEQRIIRHRSVRKKIHWHIDRIIPKTMDISKVYIIRNPNYLERDLAKEIAGICDSQVNGFGASDDILNSHLFYFRNNPRKNEEFIKIIHDFYI